MTLSRRSIVAGLLAATMLAGPIRAVTPPKNRKRPNIITIILDDVGFSDLGCFGSEIRTPNIDSLANKGLCYTHFDTKAVCSSTRAAMMTGRNSHSVNMPDVPDLRGALPGPQANASYFIPENAWNMAQVLQREGYATWAVGKWHLAPGEELKPDAAHRSWPRQRGFDYFYGFMRGWTDQYRPELAENDAYLKPQFPEGYHLSVDLADKAISLIRDHREKPEAAPFYMNLAFGAGHTPIQVPREYSRKYDDIYAKGWDTIRSERFARMKRMGIIPANTKLPPRTTDDRAWSDLSDDERAVFARYMSVYAGFMEHCDAQIGRLLEAIRAQGIERDTLIVLFSDNGAASEGGQKGEFERLYQPNTVSIADQRRRIDEIGSPKTQSGFPRPWALAGNTPFPRYKLWPYSGGVRTSLIVRWPAGIREVGKIRRQYFDVIDIAPTMLAAAGTAFPAQVNGEAQMSVAGISMLPTFASARAAGRQVQYFELRSNRAITQGRWRAVAMHDCGTPFADDKWQLFDLGNDFSESTDLAAKHPAKLAQMQALWDSEWKRYVVGPLKEPNPVLCKSGGALER